MWWYLNRYGHAKNQKQANMYQASNNRFRIRSHKDEAMNQVAKEVDIGSKMQRAAEKSGQK